MLKLHELVENSIQLFSLPDIYFQLRKVLDDKNSSMLDIVTVIKNDPAMTMRLLRLVNSAFFCFASKIETLDRAINLLGAKQVHDLALSTYVIDSSANIRIDHSLLESFWYDSLRTAVISRALAKHCHLIDSERLFVAGLLHNVGHLVMYSQIPEEAEYVASIANKQNKDLYLIEKTMLGYDYAQIGAGLMREWGLPESLQLITANHVEPGNSGIYLLETAIVHVAKTLVANRDFSEIMDLISSSIKNIINLESADLETISQESKGQANEIFSLMLPRAKAS
ncbi:MAG: HDOD domain-containing protein [Gammaproteobacteria bacterium]|nr:HDOD domain-containing protein [Gammaproteobacteria bacterium]MDH5735349.1 HDOD domain-containing protein [Gammaproteobacteria bacterium]